MHKVLMEEFDIQTRVQEIMVWAKFKLILREKKKDWQKYLECVRNYNMLVPAWFKNE